MATRSGGGRSPSAEPQAKETAPLAVHQMRGDRRMRLQNLICPYCPRPVTSKLNRQLEHVVGRKFVPKRATAKSWNLHLWACAPCNREKANLESDISAITLHQLAFGSTRSDL